MNLQSKQGELEAENRQNMLEAWEDVERTVLKVVQKRQILINKLKIMQDEEKEPVTPATEETPVETVEETPAE